MGETVTRHACNTRGRDFVVGDIHGCFDQLREAMDRVAFEPGRDRVFSVGDLVDRGPQSLRALEWLDRPWFHACMGNHEDMALHTLRENEAVSALLLLNGGQWWTTLDNAGREKYLAAFRGMPLVMEIDTSRGSVGIVHADIPEHTSWQDFVSALASGDPAAREVALWGRQRAGARVTTPVPGIDRVVCGHTVMADRRVHRKANVWFIDTGAVLRDREGGHLTLMPVAALFDDDPGANR